MTPEQVEQMAALLWQMFHPLANEVPWADATDHPAGDEWRERAGVLLKALEAEGYAKIPKAEWPTPQRPTPKRRGLKAVGE
jgi:hypothetical protein